MVQEPLLLAALLAAVVALASWLERTFGWGRAIGASLLVIVLGAVLSNLGLVATASPVYDFVGGPLTSITSTLVSR